jgi:transcriptional regulator with GAF, ATPase, and Fis domain
MSLAFLGDLPPSIRRALAAAGLPLVAAPRALLRVVIAALPPAAPPPPPWLWCATAPPSRGDAAAAVLAGACDVLMLDDELPVHLGRRLAELALPPEVAVPPPGFVARSAAARQVVGELERAARTSMAVLLTGETGTGKEVAARHIHARSGRDGAFVPINCAAIPNELIEGELFGHVRGAFSGAVADYDGQLRAAAGGTVFLDEVDDTPTTLQAKLLRVLEDHVVSRLGESAWRAVDFRVIAATNRDLGELVSRGQFGGDLYQRLAIVRIALPPLRDRGDDLPELALHLVARFYREEPASSHRVTRLTPTALAALRAYPWPGNVRELRNVVFAALVKKRAGDELLLADLPEHVIVGAPADAPPSLVDRAALARLLDAGQLDLRAALDELERAALTLALGRADGSPTRAARLLGSVGRGTARDPGGTVRAMMRRLGVGEPARR